MAIPEYWRDRLFAALLGDVSTLQGTEGQAARLALEGYTAGQLAQIEPVLDEWFASLSPTAVTIVKQNP